MSKTQKAVKTIYDEREKFIILGLTGRTGAGCTEVSKLLQIEKFDDLSLQEPKDTNFSSNEERKYEIIYKYAEKHWSGFYRISMTDIILSFLAASTFKKLKKLLDDVFNQDNSLSDNIFKDCEEINRFPQLFNIIHTDFKKCYNSKRNCLIRDEVKFQSEYDLLSKISELQTSVRKIFSKYTYMYNVKNDNDELINRTANAYTYFLQQIGTKIRASGKANDSSFSGKNMFDIARRANDFIKAIHHVSTKVDGKLTFICLDAIRNPYEAIYFQDRYSSFYLLAVNTDEDIRKKRLTALDYDKHQIQSLDDIEYGKLKGEKKFINQDIGACCQLADIYLYNPNDKNFVKNLLVRYITLIKHPGLITPTSIERCMQIAYNAKLNSGCLSRQVGAVITDENYSVKSVGWNSTAEGQVPCNLRNINNLHNNDDYNSFSSYELTDTDFTEHIRKRYKECTCKLGELNGRLFSYCFKDEYEDITKEKNQVHTRSLHAEENAFLQIAKYGGQGIKGGNLFTTASSCVLCSKKAFQLGIKKIYYIDPYPDIAIPHILDFGTNKDEKPQNILFYGAIGRAYTNLYTQRIAIKDELKNILNKKDKE